MKKLEVYSCGLFEQVRGCLLMFKSPKEWLGREEKIQGINITLAFVVFLIFTLINYKQILQGNFGRSLMNGCISISLYSLYISLLVKKAKGSIQFPQIINLSLYTHIIYLAINLSQDYRLISLVVYVIGHFYSILIQVMTLEKWFECEYEAIKIIFYIEAGIIILVEINNGLVYIGNYMIYAQKLLYYPLLD